MCSVSKGLQVSPIGGVYGSWPMRVRSSETIFNKQQMSQSKSWTALTSGVRWRDFNTWSMAH